MIQGGGQIVQAERANQPESEWAKGQTSQEANQPDTGGESARGETAKGWKSHNSCDDEL